ncbi:MAG: menaquinone biosynthesis protein [Bacteroidetes bacterium]|nr:menaquinone biosynthesis protein [Bacteroidota bacterium]
MIQKIKVGAVSYLNTRPLIYGFEQGMMQGEIDLVFDFPANIARQLLNDEIDIGLVPVAVLPLMKEYHIIGDCCIGCDGPVASVCLFSDVPLQEIKTVLLDYQSRTSVALLKILLKEHWKIKPALISAEKGFEAAISGTTAGLVIGDRAFRQIPISKYHFDLGQGWKEMTGLPFVFAAWVANKPLPESFSQSFNQATKMGIDHVVQIAEKLHYQEYDLLKYYTQNINYLLDHQKRKALQLFLQKIS